MDGDEDACCRNGMMLKLAVGIGVGMEMKVVGMVGNG